MTQFLRAICSLKEKTKEDLKIRNNKSSLEFKDELYYEIHNQQSMN